MIVSDVNTIRAWINYRINKQLHLIKISTYKTYSQGRNDPEIGMLKIVTEFIDCQLAYNNSHLTYKNLSNTDMYSYQH